MKHFYLLAFMATIAQVSMAQVTQAMFYEGKRWNYEYQAEANNWEGIPHSYVIHGDTVIAGEHCYKMYCETPDSTYYSRAVYETADHKIYYALKDSTSFQLFFDCENHCGGAGMEEFSYVETTEAQIGDNTFTLYLFREYPQQRRGLWFTWIYPIGSAYFGIVLNYQMQFYGIRDQMAFISVSDDSGVIFHYMDYFRFMEQVLADIETPQLPNEDILHCLYDLSGRCVKKPLQPGIYIKNGKKVIVK